MVPQPVQAVLMCYPITDETEAAAKKGGQGGAPHGGVPQSPPMRQSRRENYVTLAAAKEGVLAIAAV